MYKYLVLYVFIIISPLSGKTSLTNDHYIPVKPKLTNINLETTLSTKESYNLNLHPYLSLFTIIGASSTLPGGGSPKFTAPISTWVLSARIPVSQYDIYLYTQLRASFFLGKSNIFSTSVSPIIQMENSKIGGLLGIGGIIGDWRHNLIGWQLALNTGFLVESGVSNNNIDINQYISKHLPAPFIAFGPELNIMAHYSFHKYFSLNIGLHIGYQFNPYSGDPFYQGIAAGSTYFHSLTYGLSLGVAF